LVDTVDTSTVVTTTGGFGVVVGATGEGVEVLAVTVDAGAAVTVDLLDLVLVLGSVETKGRNFLFLALRVRGSS
jgi:hypothetical protein